MRALPWVSVLVFGVLVNVLFLLSPLFMLQVYDRVLPSGHGGTLLALLALVVFLYAIQILVDTARTRVLARIGAMAQARLDAQTQTPPLAEPDLLYRVFARGPVLALLDAPWAVVFALVLFWCHPLLGWLSVGGACFLSALVAGGQILAARAARIRQAPGSEGPEGAGGAGFYERAGHLEGAGPMDLRQGAHDAWRAMRARAHRQTLALDDGLLLIQSCARHGRLLLQSASLALGAWLALQGALAPGLMIAASILQGRALAPIEALVGQIDPLVQAVRTWRALRPPAHIAPPGAQGRPGALVLNGVIVAPGGKPILQIDHVRVEAGQALGVIGAAGAGKTVLAELLVGLRPALAGQMALGDLPLPLRPGQGALLGYVPQTPLPLIGPVAAVIRRYAPGLPGDADVVAVMRALGLEPGISALAQGADTVLGTGRDPLTGGLRQGITLARAFYGAPALLVLDEPNAHLDAAMSSALNRTIRAAKARGAVVVVLAHRPASISECDLLLMLEGGKPVAFGPRDAVLQRTVRNHMALVQASAGAAT